MPKWGLSMKEGTLSAWHVEEGQVIKPGQEIMDVETDKIANSVEAADGGLLRRRVGEVGQVYPVKALLGVLAPEEVSDAEIDAFVASFELRRPRVTKRTKRRQATGLSRPRAVVSVTRNAPAKATRSSSSMDSAAISTTGCSISTRSQASARSMRSTCRGMAAPPRRWPIRDWTHWWMQSNISCRQPVWKTPIWSAIRWAAPSRPPWRCVAATW